MGDRGAGGLRIVENVDAGILARLNAIRVEHGLVPLTLNPELELAAETHSAEMLANGYYAHKSPNGAPWWKRLEAYQAGAATGYCALGENLVEGSPGLGAAKAVAVWMSSPEHRQNILRAGWRDIGISAIHVHSAPGTFGDRPVTVITADFGVRH
jgi:uncharacterized protein YkwD